MSRIVTTSKCINLILYLYILMGVLLFPSEKVQVPELPLTTTLQVCDAVKYLSTNEDFNYFVNLVSKPNGVRYRHITYINKEYKFGVILGLRFRYEKEDLIRIAKTRDGDLEILEKEAISQFLEQVSQSRRYHGSISYSKEFGGSAYLKGSSSSDEYLVVHPCPDKNSVPPGLWSYYFRKDVSGN